MGLTNDQLRALVGRAMPLWERLDGGVARVPSADEHCVAQKRLDRWKALLGPSGSADRFAYRLALSDQQEKTLRAMLGDVRLASNQPLPHWAELLNAVLESLPATPAVSSAGETSQLQEASPVAFEELWLPFVEFGWAAVCERAGQAIERFSARARTNLRRGLLRSLALQGTLVLGIEFELLRRMADPTSLFRESTAAPEKTSRKRYQQFVEQMLLGGLRDLLVRYPVYARLLGSLLEQWIEATAEFCSRVHQDLPEIERMFRSGRPAGNVTGLSPGLSDPHHGGRAVICLEFGAGSEDDWKLIYKPRSLGVGDSFERLTRWLNEREPDLDLKAPRVLDRGTHGWVEHIEHRSCDEIEQVSAYYRRAGRLLCLIRALFGTDCHFENLIASGQYPVLIDAETLMHPTLGSFGDSPAGSADRLTAEALRNSVFRTGLLPVWFTGPNGKSYDLSGLGAAGDQQTGHTFTAWKWINTDQMALVDQEGSFRSTVNLPSLDGQAQPPQDHLPQLIEGFQQMHGCLVAHREALTAPNGPLVVFRDHPVRFLPRPTQVYGRMLERLAHPKFLSNGADRSIELEALAGSWIAGDPELTSGAWPIYRIERRALERSDIPLFMARPSDTALFADGERVVRDFFEQPSFDEVLSLLDRLDQDDLESQTQYIRIAMHARYTEGQGKRSSPARRAEPDLAQLAPLTPDQLIGQATAIAEQIRSQAIRGAGPSANWLTLSLDPLTGRQQIEPMGPALYGGRCGVALFLAALDHVSPAPGKGKTSDLAANAIQRVREDLAHPQAADQLSKLGLGGAAGLGGLVYSLVLIGRLQGKQELIRDAERAARLITKESVRQDRVLDVIGGSAGAILGLLALEDALRDGHSLERAGWCGRHLLESRTPTATGPRAWMTPGALHHLTGFSHGAAGICYALLRLYDATGQTEFLDAAREGIAYESSVFSHDKSSWPDYRDRGLDDQNTPVFANFWCHGPPGIGLARLGGLGMLDSPEIRQDIEHALSKTLAHTLHHSDHLCCGNLGRSEFLLDAASRYNRPELLLDARRRAAWVVERSRKEGGYSVITVMGTPSFFHGTAGIGYHLLRLAEPSRLPSVLLWELPEGL